MTSDEPEAGVGANSKKMTIILWRSSRVAGGLICFFVVFAVFAIPFVWHSPRLAFWYERVGPVVGAIITIAALTLALRK